MGIFSGIKNFVDNVETVEDNSEIEEKYIEKILSNNALNNREIFYYLVMKYKSCSCFSFGGNVEIQDTLSKYKIEKNEIPVFYVLQKKGVIFGKTNVEAVVTDSAIYCCSDGEQNLKSGNRIPISELSRYIIRHNLDEEIIDFYSENKKIIIYKKSLVKAHISNNAEVDLIYQMLFELQQKCIGNDCVLRKNRIQLLDWISNEIDLSIRNEKFQKYLLDILYHTQNEKMLYCRSINLLLKIFIYRREKSEILKLLNGLRTQKSIECQDIIGNFRKNIANYLEDLNDYDCKFSDICLWNADICSINRLDDNNIDEMTDLKRTIMQIYNANIEEMEYTAAFKHNPQIFMSTVKLSFDINNLSQEKRIQYLKLYFKFKNNSMLEAFDNISNDRGGYDKYFDMPADGYGLTPLHYALILKNNEAIE